jgi:hypothetical protein
LLSIGESETLLLFKEGFILFLETNSHVVGVSLSIALRESKAVELHWLSFDNFASLIAIERLNLTRHDEASLDSFHVADASHLSDKGLSLCHLLEASLKFNFIKDCLEGVRLSNSERT